jgi:hypothetical protein
MATAGPLTVKHVDRDGHESLTQAITVTFHPGDKQEPTEVRAFGVPDPVSDGCNRYASGRVFVMNEAGATVAKYDLE